MIDVILLQVLGQTEMIWLLRVLCAGSNQIEMISSRFGARTSRPKAFLPHFGYDRDVGCSRQDDLLPVEMVHLGLMITEMFPLFAKMVHLGLMITEMFPLFVEMVHLDFDC